MAKAKQTEMENLPNSALRRKLIEASDLKDEIGDKGKNLKEALDDIRKMLREEGKKSISFEDSDGCSRTVKLVTTGEKVSISKPEKPKKKKEDAALPTE